MSFPVGLRSFFERIRLVALAATWLLLVGCNRAYLVKAHQRELLADRIMRPDANAQERASDHHVLSTREGAVGGSGTVGGGCGCN